MRRQPTTVASTRPAVGAVSTDTLLNGQVRLMQPALGYRVALDPVFLAAAVPAVSGDRVLDLGCGVGAASLCLLARVPRVRAAGVEIQPDLVALARRNAALNRACGRFDALCGDVMDPSQLCWRDPFDHVMCNPPFLPPGARPSASPSRDLCNRETVLGVGPWVRAALASVRARGSVTFIYRADRLAPLIEVLGEAGQVTVLPLRPKQPLPAKRVIVRAWKGICGPLQLHPGFVVHDNEGSFTSAADQILRAGQALTF